jgi:hypothetical protein
LQQSQIPFQAVHFGDKVALLFRFHCTACFVCLNPKGRIALLSFQPSTHDSGTHSQVNRPINFSAQNAKSTINFSINFSGPEDKVTISSAGKHKAHQDTVASEMKTIGLLLERIKNRDPEHAKKLQKKVIYSQIRTGRICRL